MIDILKRIPPVFLLIIATICWGGNFVIGRAVAGDLPPFTLAFLRWVIAFIFFLPFAWQGFIKNIPVLKKYFIPVLFMSITGVTGFNTLLYVALNHTTAINASLMNTSTPIIIYLLSFIFFKEKLTKNQIIGTIISLFGVVFIISKGSIQTLAELSFNIGDLIVLIAVVCWSIYSLLVKHYAKKLPGNATFITTIFIGVILLLPFFLYEIVILEIPIIWNPLTLSTIFYTGIFASIIAFLAWNTGVIKIGPSRAGIFLNFIPVFATLFAVLFINETLEVFQLIGGIFVILGIFLSTRS